jgi:hypothetical protein
MKITGTEACNIAKNTYSPAEHVSPAAKVKMKAEKCYPTS